MVSRPKQAPILEYDAENLSLLAYQEIVTHYLRKLPGTSEQEYSLTRNPNQKSKAEDWS
jgi:hypothetical protein